MHVLNVLKVGLTFFIIFKNIFYDTSIVCYLLGIQNENKLSTHPLRGDVFEGLLITELAKWGVIVEG